jgi:DNA-binding transcriptional ArsR family regulator
MKSGVEEKVIEALKSFEDGLTITDLVSKTGSTRSSVRISLARLEGAKKVDFRKVGMAKLYFLKEK